MLNIISETILHIYICRLKLSFKFAYGIMIYYYILERVNKLFYSFYEDIPSILDTICIWQSLYGLQNLHFNEIQMKTLLIDHIFWYAYMNWLGPRQSNFLWLPIRLHMYTHLLIRLPQLFLNCSNNLFFLSRNKLPTFLN